MPDLPNIPVNLSEYEVHMPWTNRGKYGQVSDAVTCLKLSVESPLLCLQK